MVISGAALTFYNYLLMIDDEVGRQNPISFSPRLLTRLSERFGIYGEVARRSVRSVIRIQWIKRADEQTVRQFSTSTSLCVPQDWLFYGTLMELTM